MRIAEFQGRKARVPVEDFILKRWSPRAMSGEILSEEELSTLFEAARWAPSNSNEQPWRFVYAKRDTNYWQEFFNLLVEGNQAWCKNAAVLAITLSKKIWDDDNTLNATHSFDTGAAWENLALQGAALGLVVHGMAGFDYEKARRLLELPDEYVVEMMIAIGKPGRQEDLPEKYRQRETPNSRKEAREFAFEGRLPHGRLDAAEAHACICRAVEAGNS